MIPSRLKNQQAVRNAITIYKAENSTVISENDLLKFAKLLAAQFELRIQSDDCYFIDMMDDVQRMESI